MTGRRVVLLGLIAVLLPVAGGCGVFGTEPAESRQARTEADEARAQRRAAGEGKR